MSVRVYLTSEIRSKNLPPSPDNQEGSPGAPTESLSLQKKKKKRVKKCGINCDSYTFMYIPKGKDLIALLNFCRADEKLLSGTFSGEMKGCEVCTR